MGAISNSSRTAANLAGFYKGLQSAGAAVYWALDNQQLDYNVMFYSTWGLLAGSLLLAAPVVFMRITDTTDIEHDIKGTGDTVENVAAPGALAAEEKRAEAA